MLHLILVQTLLPLAAIGVCSALVWALTAIAKKYHLDTATSAGGKALARVVVVATAVVNDLEAILVPSLRAKCADGVLTADEVNQLRSEALARIKATLGTQGVDALKDEVGIAAGAVDGFILGVIEKKVADIPKPVPVAAVVASPALTATAPLAPAPVKGTLTPR